MKTKLKDLRNIQRKEKRKRKIRIATFTIITIFIIYRMVFSMILISSNITVTAHRGSTAMAPENTIAAVLEAAALGADCIEIDVQLTGDGQVILLHDATFKRVAGKNIRPCALTYDEIQLLNVGAYKTDTIEFHAPTLDEIIDICNISGLQLNIELKDYGYNNGLPDAVVRIVREHEFEDKCVISSYSIAFLKRVKELCPRIKVGLITKSSSITTYVKNRFVDFFSVSYYSLEPSIVVYVHTIKKEIYCWTPNSKLAVEYAIRAGVDNIITNNVTLTQMMIVSTH